MPVKTARKRDAEVQRRKEGKQAEKKADGEWRSMRREALTKRQMARVMTLPSFQGSKDRGRSGGEGEVLRSGRKLASRNKKMPLAGGK